MRKPSLIHYSSSLQCCFLLIAAAVVMLAVPAQAVVNPLEFGDEDSGWLVAVNEDWDISVVVDGLSEDAVFIQIFKTFVGEPDEFGFMDAMVVEFIKDSEDAVGMIIIRDEFVTNNTSEDWIDYHMELAVAEFNPQAGFSAESDPWGDQFDTVFFSGSEGYNGLAHRLDFYDGLVPTDPEDQDDFRPGYGTEEFNYIAIVADPALDIGQQIILKQWPTIPEPATLSVLLLGGLALLRRRHSR